MDTLPNPQPENLIVVTSLLTLPFIAICPRKKGQQATKDWN